MSDQPLAVVDSGAVQVSAPVSGLSIERAFRAVVEGELDAPKLAVMRELLAMDAQRKFNAGFVMLLTRLPTIPGYRGIPDKHGNIKFKYANFEDIDEIVRPICLSLGFTYSFRETAYGDGRATTTMTLMHEGGHFIEVPCTVRVGGGPPGSSDAQADGGAHTYGKRNALEMGLSLRIVGARDDASIEGNLSAKVTPEQAFEIERRAQETNCNVAAMLAFCKAKSFSDIPANRYDEIDALLRRKESHGR